MESSERQTAAPVIEMTDVAIPALHNPDAAVIEQVNWSVLPNDFWVIGGFQGSGKSDFIAMAGGLSTPVSGTYRLFGRELDPKHQEKSKDQRLRVGLVFDGGGRLFGQLTVGENVSLPIRYHQNRNRRETEERLGEILQALELQEWEHNTPGTLNQNWRQRAALARALALEPEILLLDNVVNGLDSRHIRWWLDFLNQLSAGHPLMHGRRMTLVVATDDFRPWRNERCHFVMLHDRRWIPIGARSELESNPEPLLREFSYVESA